MARRKKREEDKVEEANVLPVMNIMFLLIPSLLLAMEVAKMATIDVNIPQTAARPSEEPPPTDDKKEALNLKVFIQEDGFRLTTGKQQAGAAAGTEADSKNPTIPLKNPSATVVWERYDFEKLEAEAKSLKPRAKKDEVSVTLNAEGEIPMQVLVQTMDALRGSECKLHPEQYDPDSPDCLFWQPVVAPGTG